MNRKFIRVLAAAISVLTLFAIAGCSLVSVNPEMDAQQVVATVGNVDILKGDFTKQFEQELVNMQQYYAMLGMSDPTQDEETLKGFQDDVLEEMIRKEVIAQRAAELNATLTDEQKKAIEDDITTRLASIEQQFREAAETEKTTDSSVNVDTRWKELVEEQLAMIGLSNLDEYTAMVRDSETATDLEEALKNVLTADVTVTDDEVRARYDEELSAKKEDYTKTPANYYSDVVYGSGEPIPYVPEGYVYVKHVLISYASEEPQEVADNQTKMDDLTKQIGTLVAEDTDGTKDAEIQTLRSEYTALKTKNEELNQARIDAIQPKADEVYQKAIAGEDFDKLIETYSGDPGSSSEPVKTNGYLVSSDPDSSYDKAFQDAAMALQNVGDVSEPILGESGYHIIKLVTKVQSREVPYEELKDAYQKIVLEEKKTEAFDSKIEEWMQDSSVKRYNDRLRNTETDVTDTNS